MFDLERIAQHLKVPNVTEKQAIDLLNIYYDNYAEWWVKRGVSDYPSPKELKPKLLKCFSVKPKTVVETPEQYKVAVYNFDTNVRKLKKVDVQKAKSKEQWEEWQIIYQYYCNECVNDYNHSPAKALFKSLEPLDATPSYTMETYPNKSYSVVGEFYGFNTLFSNELLKLGVKGTTDIEPIKESLDHLFKHDFCVTDLKFPTDDNILRILSYILDESRKTKTYTYEAKKLFSNDDGDSILISPPYLNKAFWDSVYLNPSVPLWKLTTTHYLVHRHDTAYAVCKNQWGKPNKIELSTEYLEGLEQASELFLQTACKIHHSCTTHEATIKLLSNLVDGEAKTLQAWFKNVSKALSKGKYSDYIVDTFFDANDKEDGTNDIISLDTTYVKFTMPINSFMESFSYIVTAYALPINLKNIKEYITKYELDK